MFEEFTVYSLSSVISDDATSSATLLADARPILLPAGLLDAIKTITEPDTLFRLQALLRIIFVKNETDHANETDYASDNASLLAGLVDVLYNSYLMTTDKISLFEKEKRQKAAGKLTGPQDEAEALRWLLQNFNLEKSSADPYALYFVLTTSGIDLSLLSSQDGAHFLRAQAVTRRLLEEKRTALKLSPTNEQLDGLPVFSLTGTLNPHISQIKKGNSLETHI